MMSFQPQDTKEINAEMIKESFRRSLQDSITLEATRGILKKEVGKSKSFAFLQSFESFGNNTDFIPH